jgi:hypothetical protein
VKILPPKTIDGKVILVGDHIKISKEGRRQNFPFSVNCGTFGPFRWIKGLEE